MPAIQPARLKKQVSDLVSHYSQPAVFVRNLHVLLNLYTDHTHRSGHAGEPFPLLHSYNTPPPVMRQVWTELARAANNHPEGILPLCEVLWAEPDYDMRLLAARLLGLYPVEQPEAVVDRLQSWVGTRLEKRLLDGVLESGLERLQREKPSQVVSLIAAWLSSTNLSIQQAGLRALLPLINQRGMANLPTLIRLVTPYLRVAPSRLRPDILAVLSAFIHLSPSEAAFALRQNLGAPDNPDTAWLIRQILDEFPKDIQSGLRQAMKVAG